MTAFIETYLCRFPVLDTPWAFVKVQKSICQNNGQSKPFSPPDLMKWKRGLISTEEVRESPRDFWCAFCDIILIKLGKAIPQLTVPDT